MSFFKIALLAIGHLFKGVFTTFLGSDAGQALEAAIVKFIKTDVGMLALDAVEYASTLPAGTSNDAARVAAVTKFKADLKGAGHDVETIGTAALNLSIEMAFSYVSKTVALIPAATATK